LPIKDELGSIYQRDVISVGATGPNN